jgi:hypothetical protein
VFLLESTINTASQGGLVGAGKSTRALGETAYEAGSSRSCRKRVMTVKRVFPTLQKYEERVALMYVWLNRFCCLKSSREPFTNQTLTAAAVSSPAVPPPFCNIACLFCRVLHSDNQRNQFSPQSRPQRISHSIHLPVHQT